MIIKTLNQERDIKIIKLHKKLVGDDLNILSDKYNINVFYDKNEIVGYIIYIITENTVNISWIYAPNYGKLAMIQMEKLFKKKAITAIFLNVSIDPNENKNTVMKRLNFYIGLQYKVYDIKFRKKYGPLLSMKKNI